MHFRTLLHSFWVISIIVAAAACGADINDVPPRLIPGGGIGDGDILGLVNVSVIDGDTDEPIANARVLIGEPGTTPLEGLTDSAGQVTIEDASLDGPASVTVVADNYVPSTWFGANGANLTVPLTVKDPADVVVPQAVISGTIEGWNDLPEPAADHVFAALVTYSQTADIDDPANSVTQTGNAVCLKAPVFGGDCNFSINVRAGTIAVYAPIADVDTNGTPLDQSDDTFTVIGGAYKLDMVVEDGIDQSGVTLTQIDAGAMQEVAVTMGTPPSGLTAGAILGLDVGASGIINAGLIDPEQATTALMPSQVGDFAGATYQALGFATEENGGASSAIVLRGLADVSAGIDMGEWLALPQELSYDAGTYGFTPVADAGLHIIDIVDAQGDQLWGIALVDGRTSFTLPGVDPDPLPTGDLTFQVNALYGEVDLGDFSIDELIDNIERTSSNDYTFTY